MPPGSSFIGVSRLGWGVIAAVILLPWIFVIWAFRAGPLQPPAPAPAANTAPAASPSRAAPPLTQLSQPGPWGQLGFSRIFIEPPEDFIPPDFVTAQPLRWVFTGYTEAALDALWRQARLTPGQIQQLTNPARRGATPTGIVLAPPAELVASLEPEARAAIYTALAAFPENALQRDPFRARTDEVEDWLDDNTLPPAALDFTRRLLYRRGPNSLFSDLDLLLPRLPDNASRTRLIKTLSRKSALLVQLHVPHQADVAALAGYWTSSRRRRDIEPLLASLAQRPQGGVIDIVHLLPRFARLLLYSYPVPSERAIDALRDCHWTSFNFANDQPDDRFTDITVVQQTLLNDYYRVTGQPLLGDVIVFLQPGGVCVHSCVYIADDIVFTKNGSSFSIPWTLAHLDKVVAFYSLTEPLEIRRYRPKPR